MKCFRYLLNCYRKLGLLSSELEVISISARLGFLFCACVRLSRKVRKRKSDLGVGVWAMFDFSGGQISLLRRGTGLNLSLGKFLQIKENTYFSGMTLRNGL